MCWALYACSHDQVIRLLDRLGAFFSFLAVVIAIGAVGVAFARRRRSPLDTEIERLLDDARKRLEDTRFGNR